MAAALGAALAGCAAAPPVSGPGGLQDDRPVSEDLLAHHAAGARALQAAPLVRGNDVRLLVDGPQTHRAMFDAMERARDHINLETYILESGEVGDRLARLLEKKRKSGVKVNVLYDSVGSLGTPKEYFEGLKAAGIAVCEFNPINPARATTGWQINNRDHRKILVVDGEVAFTGGINISGAYSAGSSVRRRAHLVKPGEESARGWRDTHVRAEGPVVTRFQRLFLDGWALQDCGTPAAAKYFPKLEPRGDRAARVVANDPGVDRSEMHAALLQAIGSARRRVWLTIGYFVPDPLIVQALADAARRGVDVRLVLPGFSDFWAPVAAAQSHYDDLLEAGVQIFEWHKALMHAKTAVIDSTWSSVGSTNLDWRSVVHNYEADLVVHDAGFAGELEQRFELDVKDSVPIHPQQWRSRGSLQRMKEWFARQWEYLL